MPNGIGTLSCFLWRKSLCAGHPTPHDGLGMNLTSLQLMVSHSQGDPMISAAFLNGIWVVKILKMKSGFLLLKTWWQTQYCNKQDTETFSFRP